MRYPILLLLNFLLGTHLYAAAAAATPPPADRTVEQSIDRHPTFGERLAIGVVKRKLRRAERRAARNAQREKPPTNSMAIVSIVCGLLGLIVPSFGVFAIIFGVIGINKSNKEGRKLKGLATAGLVLGIISILILIIYLGINLATIAS